jgi:integrase
MATFREREKKKDGKIVSVVNVQVRVTGFPLRSASFTPGEGMSALKRAQNWAKTIEASMIEGRHSRNAESRRRTVAHAIERYMLEEIPKKKNGGLHKATLPWWSERIGRVKLGSVTPDLIVDCRKELAASKFKRAKPDSKRTSLKKGEKAKEFRRSGSTVNRYLATLSHVFTVARKEWGWVSSNPVTDVSKLREGKPRDKVLTEDERNRLFNQTRNDPTLHAFAVTSLSVAARAGELMNLTWADVDTEEGQVTFRDTKNNSTRSAWLTGESKKLIAQLAETDHKPTDHVFRNASGRGRYQYGKLFDAALAAARIDAFTFHGLRHSAATYLAQQGATEQQLKAIGGWKSNAVSRYVHLASHDTKAVVAAMNAKIIVPAK